MGADIKMPEINHDCNDMSAHNVLIDASVAERLELFLDILCGADKRCFEEMIREKSKRPEDLDAQIEECDKKYVRKRVIPSNKNYSLTQAAHLLKIHRQTIYYWMKKGWINPKRDYREYPVFTVLDIERIVKWRNSIKLPDRQSVVPTVHTVLDT